MKLLFSTLFAALTASVTAQPANLAERWSIEEPAYVWTAASNTIDLDYPVSTAMVDGNDAVTIYDSNCGAGNAAQTSGFTVTLAGLGTVADSGSTFSANGKTANVDIIVDLATLAGTDLYSAGAGATATIVFCVRFGLSTTGTSPLEVNFLENVITMNIDLSAGFSVDAFQLTPKDKIQATATQTYTVDAKRCVGTGADDAAKKADPEGDAAIYNQGELITVCVFPGPEALTDGLDMESLLDFTWTRTDGATVLNQPAIVSSAKETELGLTDYDGCVDKLCVFSTILSAQYYVTQGDVSGAGQATMSFPLAPAVRRLQGNKNGRRSLQADDAAAPTLSEFDLSVGIEALDDGPGALATGSGASVLGLSVTIMGLFAALLL
jgi:hypothetical protein